jgi:glycosyltransferase involved in cell wall biosynthesis
VPEAELHHFYAPVYEEFRRSGAMPHLAEFHERLEKLHEGLEGVVRHGSLPQQEVAEVYKEAKVWAYPSYCTWLEAPFPEISCITAMEAQAAGAHVVATKFGALVETVADTGQLVKLGAKDKPSNSYRERFVDAVVRALKSDFINTGGRELAAELDWSGVADEWEAEFVRAPVPAG